MKRFEKKWQKKWLKERLYEPNFLHAKKPFYNLMMFPYPSAEGLHIGATRTFSGIDIYGRFKRMQGYDVFEPIGLDGFGIHSENYALKANKHPFDHAKDSEKNFYRQLSELGNGFAWEERLETYDPAYYKWTQWIFTQMFAHGLAYRKKAPVNWCPSCKTVLADEQVLSAGRQVVNGHCERCDTVTIKKELEQWFFKITDYAERLLNNLDALDWPESIKIAQRNWIGRSEGAEVKFRIKNQESKIKVFTTRPDTIFGATYLVLSPEHSIIENLKLKIENWEEVRTYIRNLKNDKEETKEKTGVELKGIKAINPANGEEIPIWVADYVIGNVGTGAIMAVPAHDQRDFEFAQKYALPITIVVCPHYPKTTCPVLDNAYTGEGHLVASAKFNGMDSEKAKWEITKFVGGEKKVQYRLRDWLISRQRYWGPPIPMIYCEKCTRLPGGQAWQPVPEKDLPVKLPYVKNFRPTGTKKAPLANVEKFWKVKCPRCGSAARRETDVSDSFLDSSWYYLGYLILGNQKSKVKNKKLIDNQNIIKKWLPVHSYIGGAEHAVLHLLYSRFVAMALHDWGIVHFPTQSGEPFTRFRTHGLITKDGAKMSKSRGNVVNPDRYIEKYGIDAIRMYLAFLAPFEEGGDFRDGGIKGITRFLDRAEKFIKSKIILSSDRVPRRITGQIQKIIHRTIKKVTEDIEALHYNTAISALMILLNAFEKYRDEVSRKDSELFLKLLAPFAPFLTEELWQKKSRQRRGPPKAAKLLFKSIHQEQWPPYDPRLIEEEMRTFIIQINGNVRDTVEVTKGLSKEEAERFARGRDRVKSYLEGKVVKKIIFIPNRLINFVV